MKIEDVETELKLHREQLQTIKKKLRNIISFCSIDEKINVSALTHSEGKYILPIETKIKWNLKYLCQNFIIKNDKQKI